MEKIFNGIDYEVLNKGLDIKYNEIHYDSRKITEGDIFVALSGATVDGHDYIEKSISLGAKLIIVSKNVEIINKDITYVKVVDTRKVLGFIASNFYGYPQNSLKIIGVTGTNGKTTSTYLLERLIGECSRIGTVEYKIGDEIIEAPNTTPESLDLIKMMKKTVDKGIEYFIMEVSSHALEMGRVDMLEFDAAIFTNLTQDHLDYHKDMESYFQAKRKLFLKLKDSKKGVYNIDDSHGKLVFEEFGGISYAIKEGIIKGSIVENKLHSTIFSLEYNGIKRVEEVKILGLFNLYNLMGVMGALINLGYDFEELCNKLGNLVGVPGRFQGVEAGQDFMVIVDYAHTPDALTNILKSLTEIKTNKIITIFGAGGDRDTTKRPLMAAEAAKYSDIVIATSDNPRTEDPKVILSDVVKGFEGYDVKFESYVDREDAIKRGIEFCEQNDILLIAGKGHETYQIIGKEKIHFDDREMAVKYINLKK